MFKILVVEDDKALNRGVCAFLNRNGYEAVGCLGASGAYDAMYETVFDLIVSDIMMPDIDGFEFVQSVRTLNENIPILFMTARDDFTAKQRGYRAGVDDYMVKPIDLDELLLRIGALLRRAKIAASRKIEAGSFVMDADEHTACLNGEEIPLTAREFMENYNFYARFEGFPEDQLVPWYDLDEPTGRHLLSLGNRRGAVGEYATIALSGDLVVDNVYLLWVWEGDGFQVSWPLREMQRIARAMAAGEGGWAALWRLPELDAALAKQPPFAEFETDWGSLRLGASVNADGYTLRDGQLVYTGGVNFPDVFFSFMVWKG